VPEPLAATELIAPIEKELLTNALLLLELPVFCLPRITFFRLFLAIRFLLDELFDSLELLFERVPFEGIWGREFLT
jgi:hypothetical protein